MPADPHIYFIEIIGHGLVKVGYSISPIGRLGQIRSWCPFPMKIIAQVPGGHLAEAFVQDRFRDARHQGEWFYLTADLKTYIDTAREAQSLPFGALLPSPSQRQLEITARTLLAALGLSFWGYARTAGINASSVQRWKDCGIPERHVPPLVRFLGERGVTVHPWDFLPQAVREAA